MCGHVDPMLWSHDCSVHVGLPMHPGTVPLHIPWCPAVTRQAAARWWTGSDRQGRGKNSDLEVRSPHERWKSSADQSNPVCHTCACKHCMLPLQLGHYTDRQATPRVSLVRQWDRGWLQMPPCLGDGLQTHLLRGTRRPRPAFFRLRPMASMGMVAPRWATTLLGHFVGAPGEAGCGHGRRHHGRAPWRWRSWRFLVWQLATCWTAMSPCSTPVQSNFQDWSEKND